MKMGLLLKNFKLIGLAFILIIGLHSLAYCQEFNAFPYYQVKKGDSLFANKQYLEANKTFLKAIDMGAKPKRDLYYTIALGYDNTNEKKMACQYLELSVKCGLAFYNIQEFDKNERLKQILLVNSDSTYYKRLRQNTYQFENSDSICEYPDIRDELLKRKKLDQKFRNHGIQKVDVTEQRKIDKKNQIFLIACIKKIGSWPGYKEVGRKGETAAALIAIHSMDSTFQKNMIKLMESQLDNTNILFGNYALLWDKLCDTRSKNQIFGTQVEYDKQTGKAYPLELKYPDLVKILRDLYVGVPLEKYLEMMSIKNK